jgi:enoyl-CoA hydratase/carnithine racemase
MEERLTAAGGELAAEIRAGVATVTLNRPAALNALSMGMIDGLAAWLEAWRHDGAVCTIVLRGAGEKAFCAGGDIRALYTTFKEGAAVPREFFRKEYALDLAIHEYPKTIVALMDGIVMGGGMGIGQGAALRLVGERTRMAMPETAIGLFPDVGGSYFLSRLQGGLGAYLGLVGPTINAADAVYAGLADVDMSRAPAASELRSLHPAIERHFVHASVEAIVESLDSEQRPEFAEWARKTGQALQRRSPTMLKVTLEQLRRGANMTLAECFEMEYAMVQAAFAQGDFIEGIRALIIEKDNQPRWNPAALQEVGRPAVERFFQPARTP